MKKILFLCPLLLANCGRPGESTPTVAYPSSAQIPTALAKASVLIASVNGPSVGICTGTIVRLKPTIKIVTAKHCAGKGYVVFSGFSGDLTAKDAKLSYAWTLQAYATYAAPDRDVLGLEIPNSAKEPATAASEAMPIAGLPSSATDLFLAGYGLNDADKTTKLRWGTVKAGMVPYDKRLDQDTQVKLVLSRYQWLTENPDVAFAHRQENWWSRLPLIGWLAPKAVGTTACQGDSGGPVAAKVNGKLALVGGVFGGLKGDCGTSLEFTFTRVAGAPGLQNWLAK